MKTPSDTTGLVDSGDFAPEFAAGGQVVTYGYTGGGSIYGSNNDSLNICAQGYANENSLNFDIEEVLAWFYTKHDAGTNSMAEVQIMTMIANGAVNDDGSGGAAFNSEGPSTQVLAAQTLLVSDADTTWPAMTSIVFSSPVAINGTNFAIALDCSSFAASGDTLGLISDQDGEGQQYNFHKISGNWWLTDFVFGGLNNNIGLFAVIGASNVSIDSKDFLNGVQMSAFPNPAIENTTIAFGLDKAFNNVTIEVIDATGKKIASINKGALAQGRYTELIDLSNVAAGKYYYSVITNESRLTKKIMVIK